MDFHRSPSISIAFHAWDCQELPMMSVDFFMIFHFNSFSSIFIIVVYVSADFQLLSIDFHWLSSAFIHIDFTFSFINNCIINFHRFSDNLRKIFIDSSSGDIWSHCFFFDLLYLPSNYFSAAELRPGAARAR